MTSRINTRSTRSSSVSVTNKSLAILGIKSNNENLTRPPLPSKGGLGLGAGGGGLRDASNKQYGGVKRKAVDNLDQAAPKKRSVLGDVTNAIEKTISHGRKEVQKLGLQKKARAPLESVVNKSTISSQAKQANNAAKLVSTQVKQINAAKSRTLAPTVGKLSSVSALPKPRVPAGPSKQPTIEEDDQQLSADISYCEALPSSQELKLTLDSSSYITASEASPTASRRPLSGLASVVEECEAEPAVQKAPLPAGVVDYDKECEMDPFAVALYASDIFQYYKLREADFTIDKYLDKQPEITESMRSILVDWMVEVQESFELNHETLYLGVKLVDLYLSKTVITRDQLQLVGSTALFIACKFDERVPPYVDDFLYICDDAYKRKELIAYEIRMLKAIGFDLGIPLSYRYLRRYARCAKVSMEELTLARFILELSLMEYSLLDASDSAVAAAALLLARCCTSPQTAPWTATLQHYSGFSLEDLIHLVHVLHTMLTSPPRDHLKTVRNKYSHEVFYEVAKIPVPETLDL